MIQDVCMNEVLLDSATEIFETMIFMDLLGSEQPAAPIAGDAILSAITFKGDVEGCLALCCSKTCGQAIARNMLGCDADQEIADADMSDAIGEVINMVMGGVKKRLHDHCGSIELSIPQVVNGRSLSNNPGHGVQRIMSYVMIEDEHPAEFSFSFRSQN